MAEGKYKPRLGFDIRAKPPRKGDKPPKWSDPGERVCEYEGCDNQAACSLPKSPREPRARIWLCLEHAREHNRNWNFFEGMSAQEAAAARNASLYGDRPTWTMDKNARQSAAFRKGRAGVEEVDDALGVLGADSAKQAAASAEERYRDGKRLTKLQINAFETLALQHTASGGEIRRRYAELVRRFHPDSNGGDRGAEAQLADVVKAHQILKKARFV